MTAAASPRVIAFDTTVNGEKVGTWPFVELQGVLYVSRDAIDEWRIKLRPKAESIRVRGTEYWPLYAIPGFTANVSYSSQSIDISLSPDVFESSKIGNEQQRPSLSPVLPSVFANYELNYSVSRTSEGGSTDAGAIVEVGGSNDWGAISSTFAGRNLTGTAGLHPGWVHLETGFTRSMPESNYTLRVGDAGTRPGMWGRTVYFGGIQFGTNYSLTPGFFSQPIPVMSGISSSPSTVELYVNNVLRQVSQVPTGPFTIDNSNFLTGSGEARMVVRDILGREVITTQSFLSHASMLAPGLSDWGVEAGLLRRNYGLDNFNYGPAFASGTWRRGLSDIVTLEGRAEITRGMQAIGLGSVSVLPGRVIGRSTLVASREEKAGAGQHWMLGVEKSWHATGVNLQAEGSTRGFRTLGQDSQTPLPRYQIAANITHTAADFGNFGFAVAAVQPWEEARLTTLSANYSITFHDLGTFSIYASKAIGSANGLAIGASFSMPLSKNTQLSANVASQGGRTNGYVTASRNGGFNDDFGWRVLAGTGESAGSRAEGGLYYRGRYGDLNGDLSTASGATTLRVGASGGMVYALGTLFPTRRVDQSYAVAEAKDLADVGVGAAGDFVARTNSEGVALVPNLAAWVPNRIRLNPQDLPMNADVDSIEETTVPASRSAVKITFKVRAGRSALMTINLEDGESVPAGAVIRIKGEPEEFYVARQGKAYVTGLHSVGKVELSWKQQRCEIDVVLPEGKKDDITRIGPLICRGVTR